MIKIENICKKYGKKIVLNGINLEINSGDSVALVGENGCGKTTLAEIITKSMSPDDGTVKFFKNEIEYYPRIGVQYQENNWPPESKVKELIKFYKISKLISDSEYNSFFDIFEINELRNKKISTLSGGERQRVNCLLSIMNDPEILILDEFFTGLDLRMQFKLIEFLKNKFNNSDVTLIIISHVPEEIDILCNKIIFLKEGNIYKIIDIKKEKIKTRELMTSFFRGDKI